MTFDKAVMRNLLSNLKGDVITYTLKVVAPCPVEFLREMRVDPDLLQRVHGMRLHETWPDVTLRFAIPNLRYRGHQGYEKIQHARVGPFSLSRMPGGVIGVQFDAAWDEPYNHPGESQYLNLHIWVTAMAGPVGQVTVVRGATIDASAPQQLLLQDGE